MLYSFDIFDTIITRNTATPEGIFALMQYELQHDSKYACFDEYIKNNFYVLRTNSERLARENFCRRGVEEITLQQIYMCMATTGRINDHDTELLMDLELRVEWDNIIGISANIDIIHKLLDKGGRVVFLSDMYLSAKQISKLLAKVDERLLELEIMVSSDVGLTKCTGNLYKYVHNQLGIEYKAWQHYGDNWQSDVLNPLKYGIKAKRYLYPELTVAERILLCNEADVFMQLSIGNSRNCRLGGSVKNQAWMVGSSSVAPILVTYVQWILECAKKQKITRLYFIARDGYILQRIADELIRLDGYDIRTKYIYGSRKAWRMPGFSGGVEELRNIIALADFKNSFTLEKLAHILGIEISELKKFLSARYQQSEKDKEVLFCDLIRLCYNETFRKYLLSAYKGKKELAQRYLFQEMDLGDEQWAFVELHGTGFTTGGLCNLLKPHYTGKVRAFYLSMDRVGLCGDSIVYNLLSLQSSYKHMVELFCRAPHGQNIGYEFKTDRVVPILEQNNDTNWHEGNYEDYLSGILDYVRGLSNIDSIYRCCNHAALVETYFSNMINGKDRKALDYWGEMTISATNENRFTKKVAPKLSSKEIREFFLWNRYYLYNGLELSLSVLRCNGTEKAKIRYYQKYREQIIKRYHSLFKIKKEMPKNGYSHILNEIYWNYFPADIVVYGAGKFGKAFCGKAQDMGINVSAWLDKNYVNLGLDGDKDYCRVYDCKCVFIAILNSDVAQSVKCEIVELGISPDKILLLDDVIGADMFFDI